MTPDFTGLRFTEPLIRWFIAHSLGEISRTVDDPSITFLDEMFVRWGPDVIKDVKAFFRSATNIECTINYPRQDIVMPFISVVNGSENEAEGSQYLDDHGGVMVLGGGTRQLKSVPMKHQTLVYIASTDPNLTTYLYTIVRALLLVNKPDFDQYGDMKNLVVNGRDMEHRPDLFPEFGYFKVVQLMYDTNFDVPMKEYTRIGGLDVGLKVATFNFSVITPVPREE